MCPRMEDHRGCCRLYIFLQDIQQLDKQVEHMYQRNASRHQACRTCDKRARCLRADEKKKGRGGPNGNEEKKSLR